RWSDCRRRQVGAAAHPITGRPRLGWKALAISLLDVASSFWRTRDRRARLLAVLKNDCDRRVDFHAFGALWNENLSDPALVHRLLSHCRSVHLDLVDYHV